MKKGYLWCWKTSTKNMGKQYQLSFFEKYLLKHISEFDSELIFKSNRAKKGVYMARDE